MRNHVSYRAQASATLLLMVLAVGFGGGCAVAQVIVDYPRDRGTVVVSFTEILGEIGDPDREPSVRVHGDGYVLVHYPRYMKRAGDYALQLTQHEMDHLMRSLVDKKIPEFDVMAARRSKRNVALQEGLQGQVSAVLDASTTVIEVRLDRYRPAGGAQEVLNVHKKISWYGLRWDAKQYPNIEAIQNLAAAQQELLMLMERQDLEKIK